MTELKAFNKHKYKEIMIKEMKTRLPTYNYKIINDSCHCISNALNNECQILVGERKRDRAKCNQQPRATVKGNEKTTTNRTVTNVTMFPIHIVALVCQTNVTMFPIHVVALVCRMIICTTNTKTN